jgi:hypothetical protein
MTYRILLLTLVFAAHTASALFAQEGKLHLVTKRLEKSFAYKPGYELNIEGEKAEVTIESWDKAEIAIQIELTARHPDRAVAEAELERMRFVADRVRNKIYLRNYIAQPEGEGPAQARLEARYLVFVPAECPVYLKNHFGSSQVSNLRSRFRFFGEFSQVGLDNVQGQIDLRSRFGDIIGRTIGGQVAINARRSDITLEDIQGQFNIEAQYGLIQILSSSGLLGLDIQAEKSEVYLFDPRLSEFGMILTAQEGHIHYPSGLRMNFLSNTDALKKAEFKPQQEYYPRITITVSFGDIHLEKDRPAKKRLR